MVWSRLAYWQVLRHGRPAQQAAAQYRELVELPATRGAIFDRNMVQLVVNTTVYSAFVSPDQVPAAQRDRVAGALSSVLGVDRTAVMATLTSTRKFAYIPRRFSKDKADQLTAMKLARRRARAGTAALYLPGTSISSSLAANLLGFVSYDGQGQYGLEANYQSVLAGTPGYISSYRDLANNEIVLGTHVHQDPVPGAALRDLPRRQHPVPGRAALVDGVKKTKAESGSVLIMDPKTGGIVAWADYPSYNANNFAQDVDRALQGQRSELRLRARFGDEGGDAGRRDRRWQDQAEHGHRRPRSALHRRLPDRRLGRRQPRQGHLHLRPPAFAECRCDESHAGRGPPNFYKYLQAFGLTQPSGIDVAGESFVPLPAADKMQDSQYATTAFGQGINVNMVQMLAAINVIANGGKYAPPHVVERIGNESTR